MKATIHDLQDGKFTGGAARNPNADRWLNIPAWKQIWNNLFSKRIKSFFIPEKICNPDKEFPEKRFRELST